jgi:hypothetical protein
MVEHMFDPGAMLSRTYALPDGPRVRLRLPQARDAADVRLLGDPPPTDLELTALLRHDPRRRLVICATALVGGREAVVGIGAIDLDGEAAEPAVLRADPAGGEALPELIGEALVGRARTMGKLRAA